MWLSILFGAVVFGSIATSALLFFEVLPGSPEVLGIVGGFHLLFGWVFIRGYTGYRAVHRLLYEGRGELFELAVAHRIERERFATFRDIFRVRRIMGLALSGLPRAALRAVEAVRTEGLEADWMRLEALSAEAEANALLGQAWWAERALDAAAGIKGADKHSGVRAVQARLDLDRGDAVAAEVALEGLLRAGYFPLTNVVRARNRCWYADALAAQGRVDEASRHYARAARTCPRSYWGRIASRRAG